MARVLFNGTDDYIKQMQVVLSQYEKEHPGAKAALYRRNSASVRIRIIDPSFSEMDDAERSKVVWPYLRKLPDSVQDDISILLLLSPEEVSNSFANDDFENPLPSRLS